MCKRLLDAIQDNWENRIEEIIVEKVGDVSLILVYDSDDDEENYSCIGSIVTYKTWPGMAELKGQLKAMEKAVESFSEEDDAESEDDELEYHGYIFEGVFFTVENAPNELLRYRRDDERDDDGNVDLIGSPIIELICRMS